MKEKDELFDFINKQAEAYLEYGEYKATGNPTEQYPFYSKDGNHMINLVCILEDFGEKIIEEYKKSNLAISHEEITDMAKHEVQFDRQLACFGLKEANNVLYFWMKGFQKCMSVMKGKK